MRYRDTGNIHMDFHILMNRTIEYILDKYGEDFLKELFGRTARKVYREIHEHLKKYDTGPLVEYWEYYLKRENAVFDIVEEDDFTVLVVKKCPAVDHLKKRGIKAGASFCLQDIYMNNAWSEDTPFEIVTEVNEVGSCKQTVKRRPDASE